MNGINMNRILISILFLILFCSTNSSASWLVYHKPEFKGRVVDIDTNRPLEGAVVVAIYRTEAIGIGDSVDIDIHAREAITDMDGNFRIPSYTTLIQPFSWSTPVCFTIFKPGYGTVSYAGFESTFSGSDITDHEFPAQFNTRLKIRVTTKGEIMLPRVEGKDRLESYRRISLPIGWRSILPIARRIEDEENKVILEIRNQIRANSNN